MESVYHAAAKAVFDGDATNPSAVFDRLGQIYVKDTPFIANFSQLAIDTSGRKKLVKYILAQLEEDASGRPCDPDTDPATIEHILPENPLDDWSDEFPISEWEAAVYRIGNLTLLEHSVNREIGNAGYEEKVLAYKDSVYTLTRAIPEIAPEQWTLELLNSRQRKLAQRAAHIWRVDYS